MTEHRVYFPTGGEIGVTVEAESVDDAIDGAYELLPDAKLCAQCEGWGQQWSRSEGSDLEAAYVYVNGKEAWNKSGEPS